MPSWKAVSEYVEANPSVKSWVMSHFRDENTRGGVTFGSCEKRVKLLRLDLLARSIDRGASN